MSTTLPLLDPPAPAPVNSRRFSGIASVAAGAIGVWLFLALRLLPVDVMGERMWNEADVLPLARQSVDPNWIPHDWYLTQDAGYRFVFHRVAGPLVRDLGFVPAALAGRAACYALVAVGLAVVGSAIGLRPWMLVLAVIALLSLHGKQSTTGGEWFVGGFEAKAVAWGLVLLAIGAALYGRYATAALLAGLAASFHVLVGGWMSLVLWGWFLSVARGGRPITDRTWLATLARCAVGTALGAAFAVPPLWTHLSAAPPMHANPSPSYVYVFLRLPHHLSPASWQPTAWMQLTMFAAMFLASLWLLRRVPSAHSIPTADSGSSSPRRPEVRLALLVTLALLPFLGGLLIAPFDGNGTLLRYYPFRVGGALLPLGAYLLAALAVQRSAAMLPSRVRYAFTALIVAALTGSFVMTSEMFRENLATIAEASAPGGGRGTDGEEWAAACGAVRVLTPAGAVVVTPPAGGADFTWRTGRARVANFKLMPQNPRAIVEWYGRMCDLAGGADLAALPGQFAKYDAEDFRDAVTSGFKSLSTRDASRLMEKYGARHLLTTSDHVLDLPVLYRNARYTLYAVAGSPPDRFSAQE
jgi:hypothetical protein